LNLFSLYLGTLQLLLRTTLRERIVFRDLQHCSLTFGFNNKDNSSLRKTHSPRSCQIPNYLDQLILFFRQVMLESLRVPQNILNSIAVVDSCILPAQYTFITNYNHLHNIIRGVTFTFHPHLAPRFKKEYTNLCSLSGLSWPLLG